MCVPSTKLPQPIPLPRVPKGGSLTLHGKKESPGRLTGGSACGPIRIRTDSSRNFGKLQMGVDGAGIRSTPEKGTTKTPQKHKTNHKTNKQNTRANTKHTLKTYTAKTQTKHKHTHTHKKELTPTPTPIFSVSDIPSPASRTDSSVACRGQVFGRLPLRALLPAAPLRRGP